MSAGTTRSAPATRSRCSRRRQAAGDPRPASGFRPQHRARRADHRPGRHRPARRARPPRRADFDLGTELDARTRGRHGLAGLASLVGLVRDMAGDEAIGAMTLEHYPVMTEKKLAEIEEEAWRRWPLQASLVIHRYGRLEP